MCLWIMGIFDVLRKAKKEEFVDIDKDLKSITRYLKGVNGNVKKLDSLFKDFQILRRNELHLKGKEFSPDTMKRIIRDQIKVFDKIIKIYEFFQLDTDISGERVKKIGKALKNKAYKLELSKDLLKKLETDEKWTFDW